MFTELRHHLTSRRIFAAAAVLCALAMLAPWLPPVDGLRDRMETRHLTARGRSQEQVQQQQEASRRATQEAERQRIAQERAAQEQQQREAAQRAEQERQAAQRRELEAQARQKERDHGVHAEDFKRTSGGHLQPIREMMGNVDGAVQAIRRAASRADFYRGNVITPEETSSRRACDDPAGTADLWNRDDRRDRNIYACAVFLATTQEARREPQTVTVALLQRINQPELARAYPLHTLVAYAWISIWRDGLRRGQDVPRLPEMTADGESLNPALFAHALPVGFARRLYATATTEEKIALARVVYPDLKRLSELNPRLLAACRAMQRTNCLDVE